MILVHDLTKRFSEKKLFEHLSFTLPERGLYLLCGPNGCGKSTLLYILAGLDLDYTGDVLVGGEEALLSLEVEFEKQKKIYLIDELTSALNEEYVLKAMEHIHKQSEESLILMATHDKRILSSGTKIEMEALWKERGRNRPEGGRNPFRLILGREY